MTKLTRLLSRCIFSALAVTILQPERMQSQNNPPPFEGNQGPPGAGRFFGPPGGPGGPGPMGEEIQVLDQFDQDKDGILNQEERAKALKFLEDRNANSRGPGRRGPRGGGRPGGAQTPPQPGIKVSPEEVEIYPDRPVFDPLTLRTWFLDFDTESWEAELAAFKNTDVEMPATLQVDGKVFQNVGVHFRGTSSFFMISEGLKRSLNLKLDWVNKGADIGSYNTFNLLNSNDDPSFLRAVLYYQICREFIPAPKANLIRLVINGENWGIYVNAQQFDKDLLKDHFGTKKGTRWKVPGSPNGRGGLNYLGNEIDSYRGIYEMKSKENEDAWQALIELTRVLNQTPAEELIEKLSPILDIDGALKFLALDIALVNNDGYWVRASDYNLYRDVDGRFHFIPHDANETFSTAGGPGFGRGPGGGGPGGPGGRPGFGPPGFRRGPRRPGQNFDGPTPPEGFPPPGQRPGAGPNPDFRGPRPDNTDRPPFGPGGFPGPFDPGAGQSQIDPLALINREDRPLASKLLAVPELKERYLRYVKEIADTWLDWDQLGPIAESYHILIAEQVAIDTRKLDSIEAFRDSLVGGESGDTPEQETFRGPGPRRKMSLKQFADERRAYFLNHPEIKSLE